MIVASCRLCIFRIAALCFLACLLLEIALIPVEIAIHGILNGDGFYVDYDELKILLDKDETPERDIAIGWENSNAIISDLTGRTIDDVYWVPKKKPEGIVEKNPDEVFYHQML